MSHGQPLPPPDDGPWVGPTRKLLREWVFTVEGGMALRGDGDADERLVRLSQMLHDHVQSPGPHESRDAA